MFHRNVIYQNMEELAQSFVHLFRIERVSVCLKRIGRSRHRTTQRNEIYIFFIYIFFLWLYMRSYNQHISYKSIYTSVAHVPCYTSPRRLHSQMPFIQTTKMSEAARSHSHMESYFLYITST